MLKRTLVTLCFLVTLAAACFAATPTPAAAQAQSSLAATVQNVHSLAMSPTTAVATPATIELAQTMSCGQCYRQADGSYKCVKTQCPALQESPREARVVFFKVEEVFVLQKPWA